MADEAPTDETPVPAPAGPKRFLLPGGALVAGAVIGMMVVGPKFAPKTAGAAPAEQEASEAEHGGKEGEKPALVKLDNLIVNPAGSDGSRYLVITVAFEVKDAKAQAKLSEADVQLRDAVSSMLERRTLADLTLLGARDSIRRELTEVARPFAGGAAVRTFIPQFLIQ